MIQRAAAVFFVILAVACASPMPTLSPPVGPTSSLASQSARPLPSPSPQPFLHVDGTATTAGSHKLVVWPDPTDRSDPGGNPEYVALGVSTEVFVVSGPRNVDGTDYWQIYPSAIDYTAPLGWVAATDGSGRDGIAPYQVVCPPAESSDARPIGEMRGVEAVGCYGDRELRLRGYINCQFAIIDGILAGPMLSSTTLCLLDRSLPLYGPVVTVLPGASAAQPPSDIGYFQVRGHFDDAGAQQCYQTPFGTSLEGSRDPGDPGAIQECRTFFVVTAAEQLTN
jgi:hypothetical protein